MTPETPWFERDLIFGKPKALLPYFLERLEGALPRIEYKLKDIPESILSMQPMGKWSIKQNIGHLAEVDEISNKRIDEMLAGISPLSPAVFEPRGDYNIMPIQEVVQFLSSIRKANLEKYKSLAAADLEKASLHPRLKIMMTPVDLAWFDAEHDDHHLVKINNILKASV